MTRSRVPPVLVTGATGRVGRAVVDLLVDAGVHADIERLIATAGVESTIIRPGMFASNALFWWSSAIRTDGVVR